jgi:hypothetical protein
MTTQKGGRKFIHVTITQVNIVLFRDQNHQNEGAYLLFKSRLIWAIQPLSRIRRHITKAAFKKLLIKQRPWKSLTR